MADKRFRHVLSGRRSGGRGGRVGVARFSGISLAPASSSLSHSLSFFMLLSFSLCWRRGLSRPEVSRDREWGVGRGAKCPMRPDGELRGQESAPPPFPSLPNQTVPGHTEPRQPNQTAPRRALPAVPGLASTRPTRPVPTTPFHACRVRRVRTCPSRGRTASPGVLRKCRRPTRPDRRALEVAPPTRS